MDGQCRQKVYQFLCNKSLETTSNTIVSHASRVRCSRSLCHVNAGVDATSFDKDDLNNWKSSICFFDIGNIGCLWFRYGLLVLFHQLLNQMILDHLGYLLVDACGDEQIIEDAQRTQCHITAYKKLCCQSCIISYVIEKQETLSQFICWPKSFDTQQATPFS